MRKLLNFQWRPLQIMELREIDIQRKKGFTVYSPFPYTDLSIDLDLNGDLTIGLGDRSRLVT